MNNSFSQNQKLPVIPNVPNGIWNQDKTIM